MSVSRRVCTYTYLAVTPLLYLLGIALPGQRHGRHERPGRRKRYDLQIGAVAQRHSGTLAQLLGPLGVRCVSTAVHGHGWLHRRRSLHIAM
jgi:hypothetical protein